MRTAQFQLHARVEESHWWFTGRRQILRSLVHQVLPAPARGPIIDVGCGTGANIAALAEEYDCTGIDPSHEAIELARSRFPAVRFVCGQGPDTLDALVAQARLVLLMDVLEHVPDDFALLSSLLAAAATGTIFLVTVPANPAFWSAHDESNGHYRRYDPARLRRLWEGLPVTTRLLSHFNARLYPMAALVRAWSQWRGQATGQAGTDVSLPAGPINAALHAIFSGESRVLVDRLRRGALPGYAAGLSLLALLRREAGPIRVKSRPGDVPPDQYDPGSGRRLRAQRLRPADMTSGGHGDGARDRRRAVL
jgi:SAM-dependent methyltransferase